MAEERRINGWKAIGAHFGRDRTTAIRWAQSRGLPVRRLPGGKRASVYALPSELDQWARGQSELNDEGPPDEAPPERRRRPWKSIAAVAGALVLTAAVGAVVFAWRPEPRTLPRDREVAALYLEARDNWAQRRADTIQQAIDDLYEVIRREPDFAPGHSALADAYLLAREFGAMDDRGAFESARAAAEKAKALDARLAGPHRALGFIRYWWDHDARGAQAAFEKARALDPDSAQTRFWYGNVLSDNGAHEKGLAELDAARAIEPGSVAIQTDLAWARWAAGQEEQAVAALEALKATHPDFAVVHDSLAHIQLARRDYAGYVAHAAEEARVRGKPDLVRRTEAYRAALARGQDELHRLMVEEARAAVDPGPQSDQSGLAFLLSLEGDRTGLLAVLDEALARRERWGSAGRVERMQRAWKDDPEISGRLARLRMPIMN